MPHIDTAKIEGYESMNDQQKIAALLGLEIPEEMDKSKWVPKSTLDAKLTELADLNKKYRGKLTEEEKTAADRAAQDAAKDAEIADWKGKFETAQKQLTINSYKTSYIALGYDEKLAQETAEAMAEGKMDIVLANGKKHQESMTAKIKEELMKGDPHPGGGDGKGADAAVEFAKAQAKARTDGGKALNDTLKYYS